MILSWEQINFRNVPKYRSLSEIKKPGLYYNISKNRYDLIAFNDFEEGAKVIEWAKGNPDGMGLQYWYNGAKFLLRRMF